MPITKVHFNTLSVPFNCLSSVFVLDTYDLIQSLKACFKSMKDNCLVLRIIQDCKLLVHMQNLDL